jgi:hypothetical protein
LKTLYAKPRLVAITDPAEIDSITRNGSNDIIGFQHNDQWYGYAVTVERFRALNAALPPATD